VIYKHKNNAAIFNLNYERLATISENLSKHMSTIWRGYKLSWKSWAF